jgi:6-pyruvoyltetrahydropterin/6-carboxytetrahydropterin synthase
MFQITKECRVSSAHSLNLSYDSPCANVHGHNWKITVKVVAKYLNKDGMVIDFTHIKDVVKQLDHTNINTVVTSSPTAENIAEWISLSINNLIQKEDVKDGDVDRAWVESVTVQETEGNVATYIKD